LKNYFYFNFFYLKGGLFGSAAKPPAFGLGQQPTSAPTFGQATGGSLFGSSAAQPTGGKN
jgi:hypothetical protein